MKIENELETRKEINNNMSLEEITLCVLLSDVFRTIEFKQLAKKGQTMSKYKIEIPDNLKLENFQDSSYLINRISQVKEEKKYNPGNIKDLEEMFLCLFSDMEYQEIEYKLVKFLNENYYKDGTPFTNRMLHSQQAMLITGLICRSNEIPIEKKQTLLCMASAIVHDIGHVPGAHTTEDVLFSFDGFFSHEINGRNVIENIINRDEENIIKEISSYYQHTGEEVDNEKIKKCLCDIKTHIKKSIEAHSRSNSEKRGEGTVEQLPRLVDKIVYSTSDLVDVLKRNKQMEVLPKDWIEGVIKELGKGYYEKESTIREIVETIKKQIETNNFGAIVTEIANTVSEVERDGKIYYDVDQNRWNVLNKIIKYSEKLRKKDESIDRKKDEKGKFVVRDEKSLRRAATIFVIAMFNKCFQECNESIEKAWEKTLDIITQSNDIDILNVVDSIMKQCEDNPEKLKEMLDKGGILDTRHIYRLNNSNRQIKLIPNGKFQMSELLPYLGEEYYLSGPEKFIDIYYDRQNRFSICLRKYDNNENILIVRRERDKVGVTQVEREIYETNRGDKELNELIQEFNEKYPEIKLQIPKGNPKCLIKTKRYSAKNDESFSIRRDISFIINGKDKIPMPEIIEIDCNEKSLIKSLRQKISAFLSEINLSLAEVSTKDSKEAFAMRLMEEQENSK